MCDQLFFQTLGQKRALRQNKVMTDQKHRPPSLHIPRCPRHEVSYDIHCMDDLGFNDDALAPFKALGFVTKWILIISVLTACVAGFVA